MKHMLPFSIKLHKINDTPSNFYRHQYEVKYHSAAFIDPAEVVLSHAGRHFNLFLRCQTFLLNCITATFSVAVHVEITCEIVMWESVLHYSSLSCNTSAETAGLLLRCFRCQFLTYSVYHFLLIKMRHTWPSLWEPLIQRSLKSKWEIKRISSSIERASRSKQK